MIAPKKLNNVSDSRSRWQALDREWLEHQHFVLGKTYKEISKEFGMSQILIIVS